MKAQKYLYFLTLFAITFIFLNGKCKKQTPPPPPPPGNNTIVYDKKVVFTDPAIINGSFWRPGLPPGCVWNANIPATYTFEVFIYDYSLSPPAPTLWSTSTARNTDIINVGNNLGFNINVPSNDYFYIQLTIAYDNCTDCCGQEKLGTASGIVGCLTNLPGMPDQGRPEIKLYTDYYRQAVSPGPYPFMLDEVRCICSCDY